MVTIPLEAERLLRETRFLNGHALEGFFDQVQAECEFLRRPEDKFAKIDSNEVDAGLKVLARLRLLKRREEVSPPKSDVEDAPEPTPEQIAAARRRLSWEAYSANRTTLLPLGPVVLEYLDVRPGDIGTVFDQPSVNPPDDWDPERGQRVFMAARAWRSMSDAERDAIPQIMVQRRVMAARERNEARLVALEQEVTSLREQLARLEAKSNGKPLR